MRRIGLLLLAFVSTLFFADAQQVTRTVTITARNYTVADNLDLEAVATALGEADNLEAFERALNDPQNPLSNLDLNDDGYVDYLRVVEMVEDNERYVLIQAVLGEDLYQDVATLLIESSGTNAVTQQRNVTVTIVGDPYIYGENYVIVPTYVYRPVIFDWWWGPHPYVPYWSPYYWGYYPHYYYCYHPCAPFHYHRHIHSYSWHHPRPTCDRHVSYRANPRYESRRSEASRRDYAREYATHTERIASSPSSSRSASRLAQPASSSSRSATAGSASRSATASSASRSATTSRTTTTVNTGSRSSGSRSTTSTTTSPNSNPSPRRVTTSVAPSGSTRTSGSSNSSRASGSSSSTRSTSSSSYSRPSSSSSSRVSSSSSSTRTTSSSSFSRPSSSSSSSSSSSRGGGFSSGGSRGGSMSSGGSRSGGMSSGGRSTRR